MGWAAAAPYLIQAGSSIAGYFASKKLGQPSPQEQSAIGGQQNLAGGLAGTGLSSTQGAASYWSRLLTGNRAAMAGATAGPRAAITDAYRGAENNLSKNNVRGGSLDLAKSELSRDRAGSISRLVTGVQPEAATQLQSLGSGATGQASGLYQSLVTGGQQNRFYGDQQGQQLGSQIGGLLFDILRGVKSKSRTAVPSSYSGLLDPMTEGT